MFDYLRCDYPLPDGRTFKRMQTKTFHCNLNQHVITKDGQFLQDVSNFGSDQQLVPVNYWGVIKFHGGSDKAGEDEPNSDDWKLYRYEAMFRDGKLIEIRAAPDSD